MTEEELKKLKEQMKFYKISGISEKDVKELGSVSVEHVMLFHMEAQTHLLVAILEELQKQKPT
jgi:hypothetical protein